MHQLQKFFRFQKYSNNLALFVENRGYTYKKLRKSLQIAYYLNLNFKRKNCRYLFRDHFYKLSVIGCLLSEKHNFR